MSGMLAIVNASDADFENLTAAIANADGTAQRMADTMNDNLKGAVTILKSACEGFGISLYETFSGPAKKGVEILTGYHYVHWKRDCAESPGIDRSCYQNRVSAYKQLD